MRFDGGAEAPESRRFHGGVACSVIGVPKAEILTAPGPGGLPEMSMARRSQAVTLGLLVGIAGSFLDYYSGYQISQSGMMLPGMGITQVEYNTTSLSWGIGIMALGTAVFITALLGATSLGRERMKLFGSLMATYGVLMLFVGISMYEGVTPMMQGSSLLGSAMVVVGVLMTLGGGLMVLPRAGSISP